MGHKHALSSRVVSTERSVVATHKSLDRYLKRAINQCMGQIPVLSTLGQESLYKLLCNAAGVQPLSETQLEVSPLSTFIESR
jgi:hypothetical protein